MSIENNVQSLIGLLLVFAASCAPLSQSSGEEQSNESEIRPDVIELLDVPPPEPPKDRYCQFYPVLWTKYVPEHKKAKPDSVYTVLPSRLSRRQFANLAATFERYNISYRIEDGRLEIKCYEMGDLDWMRHITGKSRLFEKVLPNDVENEKIEQIMTVLFAKYGRDCLFLEEIHKNGQHGWQEYEFSGRWYLLSQTMADLAARRFLAINGERNVLKMTLSEYEVFRDAQPDVPEKQIFIVDGTADFDPPLSKYLPELLDKTVINTFFKIRRKRVALDMGFTYDENIEKWVPPAEIETGWTFNKTLGYWEEDEWESA